MLHTLNPETLLRILPIQGFDMASKKGSYQLCRAQGLWVWGLLSAPEVETSSSLHDSHTPYYASLRFPNCFRRIARVITPVSLTRSSSPKTSS